VKTGPLEFFTERARTFCGFFDLFCCIFSGIPTFLGYLDQEDFISVALEMLITVIVGETG